MRQEILDFCHRLGKNKLLVQGGGGNVSWKTKSKLWIKASGTNLGSAKYKNIFTAVDLNQIKNAIKNKKFFQRIIFKPKNWRYYETDNIFGWSKSGSRQFNIEKFELNTLKNLEEPIHLL